MNSTENVRKLLETVTAKERIVAQQKKVLVDLKKDEAAAKRQYQKVKNDFLNASKLHKEILGKQEKTKKSSKLEHDKVSEAQLINFLNEIGDINAEASLVDKAILLLKTKIEEGKKSIEYQEAQRKDFVKQISSSLSDISEIVAYKIKEKNEKDSDCSDINVSACIRVLAEITREREQQCSAWMKYSKEISELIKMKQYRIEEIQMESDLLLTDFQKKQKEGIDNAIKSCEAERKSLVAEIEQLKQEYFTQLEQLKNVRVVSNQTLDHSVKQRMNGVALNNFLKTKISQTDKEKEILLQDYKSMNDEKQKLNASIKNLRRDIENEKQRQKRNNENVNNAIKEERLTIKALEAENNKLASLCEDLVKAINNI